MLSLSKMFSLLGQILSSKDREHRVGDGDSLAWLAEKYGTTVKALKKLNNMKDDVIYSGRFVTLHSDMCCAEFVYWQLFIFHLSLLFWLMSFVSG